MRGVAVDIAGQRFGKLVAVERVFTNKRHNWVWRCKCDCGNEHLATAGALRRGDMTSCSCKWRSDIQGRRFGRLVAVKITSKRHHNKVVWLCRCDCGLECEIIAGSLISGNTRSCGCLAIESRTKHGLSNTRTYKNERHARRHAQKVGTYIPFSSQELQIQIEELGNHCVYCGGLYEHLDHFMPLSKGGKHALSNLVPSCKSCNLSKNSKIPGTGWWPESWSNS